MTIAAIAIVGVSLGSAAVGFIGGILHERRSRTNWIRSLPTRDLADLMMEEF